MQLYIMHVNKLSQDEKLLTACATMQDKGPGWLSDLQEDLDVATYSRPKMQGPCLSHPTMYRHPREDARTTEATTSNGRPSSSRNESTQIQPWLEFSIIGHQRRIQSRKMYTSNLKIFLDVKRKRKTHSNIIIQIPFHKY
mmetsp:Transcript_59318/g.145077  ORF Transcript_59318/g.145077 Transcript_59318/m.145077 type:complete len:140 (-) Transcript_59318:732-1151(-)